MDIWFPTRATFPAPFQMGEMECGLNGEKDCGAATQVAPSNHMEIAVQQLCQEVTDHMIEMRLY